MSNIAYFPEDLSLQHLVKFIILCSPCSHASQRKDKQRKENLITHYVYMWPLWCVLLQWPQEHIPMNMEGCMYT